MNNLNYGVTLIIGLLASCIYTNSITDNILVVILSSLGGGVASLIILVTIEGAYEQIQKGSSNRDDRRKRKAGPGKVD